MRIIKSFLLLVLFVVAGYAALQIGSRHIPALKQISDRPELQQIQPQVSALIASGMTRLPGNISSSGVGSVLGISDQNADGKSLPEKTFNYARYSYCKEVVRVYEKEN